MLSAASAQAPASEWLFEISVDCDGTLEVYEAVVVNAGTYNINAQLIAPDGSTKNLQANIQSEQVTLEGQSVCGCVTTPDTGEESGNVTHCIGMYHPDTNPYNLTEECRNLYFVEDYADWGSYQSEVTNVMSDGVTTLFQIGEYDYNYVATETTTSFGDSWTCVDYSCDSPWDESIYFVGADVAACVASVAPEDCPEPVVCPEDLTDVVDSLESANVTLQDELAAAQQQVAFFQNLLSTQAGVVTGLNADVDSLEAIVGNLATENADLAVDLYECQDYTAWADQTIAALQSNAVTTGEALASWQEFALEQQHAALACESVNDSLLNELADLTLDLANMTAEADTCFDEYSALDDQFIAAVEDYEAIIDNLNDQLTDLETSSTSVIAVLQGQLDECGDALEAASAAAAACPAAIEDAVAEATAQALATCQGDAIAAWQNGYDTAAEECNESCLLMLNDAYDGGVADGIAYAEDELFPPLLAAEYELGYSAGYQDGLEDCEGTVSGLVDIDGTIVPVIGYFNELGQTINPNTTDGIIIRRHADGTFSKYIKSLR